MKINEMEYKECLHNPKILAKGFIYDVAFAVISYGTHPCAYIENVLNIENYEDVLLEELPIHGGATYLGNATWDENDTKEYIGWDYAHLSDYCGYYKGMGDFSEFKKWNTNEIYTEVKEVIKLLIQKYGAGRPPIIDNLFDAIELANDTFFYYKEDNNDIPLTWWKVGYTAESSIGLIGLRTKEEIELIDIDEAKKKAEEKCKSCGYCYDEIFLRKEPPLPFGIESLYSLTFRLFLPKTKEGK